MAVLFHCYSVEDARRLEDRRDVPPDQVEEPGEARRAVRARVLVGRAGRAFAASAAGRRVDAEVAPQRLRGGEGQEQREGDGGPPGPVQVRFLLHGASFVLPHGQLSLFCLYIRVELSVHIGADGVVSHVQKFQVSKQSRQYSN